MPEQHTSHRSRRMQANPWLIFAVIGVGSFLGPLSGSIVNVALPSIAKDYQADIQSVKWVVLVYLLVMTFLLPLAGKWGQRYGEGLLYILGFAIYAVASALAGLSSHVSLYALVGARALQAAGASLLFATSGALATHYVPPERRGLAFGMIGSIVAISLVAGPLAGGLICANNSWPWIFWVLVPIAVAGFISALVLLPRERFSVVSTQFPLVSSFFWFALVTSFTLVGEAFSKGLWFNFIWLTVAVAVVSLLLFIASERRGPSLFDYSMFRIPAFNLGMQGLMMMNLIVFIMVLFLPFLLEDYMNMPLDQIGMLLGLSPLMSFLFAPVAGHLSDRIGFRLPIIAGLATLAAGFAVLAASIDKSPKWEIGLAMALMGAGAGMFSGPNFAAVMGCVSLHQRPLASSLSSLTRNIGFMAGTSLGSIGLGLFLAMFGGRKLMVAARSEVLSPQNVPTAAFHFAFSRLLWLCAALAVAGLIVSLRFPNRLGQAAE